MAEGQENDDSSEQSPNNGDINVFNFNELNLGFGNGQVNIDSMVHAYTQEYEHLDHTMDELDSWMNKIEEQNDSLNAQLDDLLKSSIEARKELQEQNADGQSEQDADSGMNSDDVTKTTDDSEENKDSKTD